MGHKPFEELPEGEQADFIAVCLKPDWLRADFHIYVNEDVLSGVSPEIVERHVVIESKANGARAHYVAEQNSPWSNMFERDLLEGVFGEAPDA